MSERSRFLGTRRYAPLVPRRFKLDLQAPVANAASLDFASGNDAHYYQMLNGPALPDADWSILLWVRVAAGDFGEACHISAAPDGGTVFDAGSFLMTSIFGSPSHSGILMNGNSGELIPLTTDSVHTQVAPAGEYLLVAQRRSGFYQYGAIPKGATSFALREGTPVSAWSAIPSRRWDIGRRFYFSSTPSPHAYAELAVLTHDSLSNAELLTLAAGAPVTAVRNISGIRAYLKFHGVNDTEPDVTGNGHNAVRTGPGFTVGPAFFGGPAPARNFILRPFADSNPYYQPISANAVFTRNDARITAFRDQALKLKVNAGTYVPWLYQAAPGDPDITFDVSPGHIPGVAHERRRPITIKLPPTALPDGGRQMISDWSDGSYTGEDRWLMPADRTGDAHLTIIEPNGMWANELWYAHRVGSPGSYTYRAGSWVRMPYNPAATGTTAPSGVQRMDGLGVNGWRIAAETGNYYNPNYDSAGWGGAVAAKHSSALGIIRKAEIVKPGGVQYAPTDPQIQHALALSVPKAVLGYVPAGGGVIGVPLAQPHQDNGHPLPAYGDDGDSMQYAGNIVMGTRFALPPEYDIESKPWPESHKRLARALKTFGCFLKDQAGHTNVGSAGDALEDGNALNSRMDILAEIHAALVIVNP